MRIIRSTKDHQPIAPLSGIDGDGRQRASIVAKRSAKAVKGQRAGVVDATSVAALCTSLINVEEDFDARFAAARAHIQFCDQTVDREHSAWLAASVERTAGNADRLMKQATLLVKQAESSIPEMSMSAAERRFVLTQYAPQALLSGCVLQNLANAANSHETISAHAHSIHSWYVGGGSHASNHAVLYRDVLRSIDVHLPATGSSLLQDCVRALPVSWRPSAYRLSLSLFPKEFLAEILGAALCELMLGVPAIVQVAVKGSNVVASNYLAALQSLQSPAREMALEAARSAIAEVIAISHAQAETVRRVLQGCALSFRLFNDWNDEMSRLIRNGYLAPAREMIELVRGKAKYAVGYHRKLTLAKQPFDELIEQDPERFVRELASSRWISPGRPQASLLLTRLIAFGGPMFRIFSDAEIEVISRWISSLPATAEHPAARPSSGFATDVPTCARPTQCASRTRSAGRIRLTDRRGLYHRLLHVDRYPEARTEAFAYVSIWLARTARESMREHNALPFEIYTHENFRDWFETKALAQAQSYRCDAKRVDKTRDEVIDEALQLCPMIFIDGAWLQRWSNAGLVDGKIGCLLYKIFSDEIGNGDTRLNHPNIYRDLIRQMGVDLPDFRTREFAYSERFTDDAFAVPVFWLSVSQFPRRFQPETLGLNLAMELSGVGGAYRTAHDELRHYGFSTLFVDLHNTIDNVSSGHSGMALKAIELYMDEFVNSCSPGVVAAQWRRVWTGFRALLMPKRAWTELFARPRYQA